MPSIYQEYSFICIRDKNVLQEKQWMEQLENGQTSKNIAVKAPHKPPSHQMQKKRRFRPGTVALREIH